MRSWQEEERGLAFLLVVSKLTTRGGMSDLAMVVFVTRLAYSLYFSFSVRVPVWVYVYRLFVEISVRSIHVFVKVHLVE